MGRLLVWRGEFLKDRKVTNYSEKDGLSSHPVLGFERDRNGMIWVVGKDGLARLEGSRWRTIGAEWNFFGAASSIFLDHKGTLWAGTPESIFFLTQGTKKFQMAADHLKYVSKLAEAPDGTLWMAETRRAVRPVPRPAKDAKKAAPEIIMGSQAIAFDDKGSLWIASLGDRIRRVPYPERLEGSRAMSRFLFRQMRFCQQFILKCLSPVADASAAQQPSRVAESPERAYLGYPLVGGCGLPQGRASYRPCLRSR